MLQNHATLKQIRFHLLSELRQIYTENESDSIMRLIMEHIGYPLDFSLREPGQKPALPVYEKINGIIADIRQGLPIQYILGRTQFCDLDIKVDERALIPRPETEEMMEHIKSTVKVPIRRIIDLGTGSGCLALALKSYFSEAEVWGVDKSSAALSLAMENGRNNELEVKWKEMDLLRLQPGEQFPLFDLVVCNPPYVMNRERDLMASHVKDFEPSSALFVADDDPLIFYRAIVSFFNTSLAEKGEIWVEINEQYGEQTARLFEGGGFPRTRILKDIHDKERFINACR
jgi:release factor glutamine methyltransferase